MSELEAQGKLPDTALFSSTPPDPAYAAMTPATTPSNLAPVFAIGFGTEHLLTNDFRLAYLQDASSNPDGGFPTLTDGLPPANPAHPFRQALKTNDQRVWTPTSPMLLCAGNVDPAVLYLNTAADAELLVDGDERSPCSTSIPTSRAATRTRRRRPSSPWRRTSFAWPAATPRCWRSITPGSWRRSA